MKSLVLAIIFVLFTPHSFSAHLKTASSAFKSRSNNQVLYHIPFELYGAHIYIPVSVNNFEPRIFLLDSGAQIAHIRAELAQSLNFKLGGNIGVTGTGTGRISANYVNDVNYEISGARFTDEQSIALPSAEFFQPLENAFGHNFDGVLGYDLLSRYVVEIDYANQTINLYKPSSYNYSGSGEIIPIRINDKKPYLTAMLTPIEGVAIECNLHIDLGSGGGLSFNGNFVQEKNLVQSAQTTIESFNRGAGGETATRTGRLKSLHFGNTTLINPLASFALAQGRGVRSDSAGRIGGMIWQRFKVVLDYSRKRMILEPNANFEMPFEADMSGISLVAENPDYKAFVVYKITENTPASDAGVHEGDYLLAIDNKMAAEFTLEQIREMFRQNGREYLLGIKRAGKNILIKIKLRKLI